MARWDRAMALLPFRRGRVLDLGCAFGFATLRLARKGYETVGVDNSARYVAWAKRRHPQGQYLLASAEALPLPDVSFDGILFLDVLEHVVDESAVIREIRRILKPGGTLILSVPHRGLLGWLDSRHYSLKEVQVLLGPEFRTQRIIYTGLGLAELVNLPLLVGFRYILRWELLYQILQYIYFLIYLLEDLLPLGPAGYHLMVVATKIAPPAEV